MQLEMARLDGGLKLITLTGRLDLEGANAIDMQLTAHTATERSAVVVDLSAVEFVASMGMRLLLSNAKAIAKRGGKLVLIGARPAVTEAFGAAGIDTLIPMYVDLDAARSAFT